MSNETHFFGTLTKTLPGIGSEVVPGHWCVTYHLQVPFPAPFGAKNGTTKRWVMLSRSYVISSHLFKDWVDDHGSRSSYRDSRFGNWGQNQRILAVPSCESGMMESRIRTWPSFWNLSRGLTSKSRYCLIERNPGVRDGLISRPSSDSALRADRVGAVPQQDLTQAPRKGLDRTCRPENPTLSPWGRPPRSRTRREPSPRPGPRASS